MPERFCGWLYMDVSGILWTNLLPRPKNKATIEVFAGHLGEESDWETTTYCPSTRLVSRSKNSTVRQMPDPEAPEAQGQPAETVVARWQSGYAAACKAVYPGSIPSRASSNKVVLQYCDAVRKLIYFAPCRQSGNSSVGRAQPCQG